MRKLFSLALGAMLVSGVAGYAQTTTAPTGQAGAVSDAQIKQRLESQGYSNVQVTDHGKNHVDVTASKNGQRQKLAVDPRTGQAMADTDKDED